MMGKKWKEKEEQAAHNWIAVATKKLSSPLQKFAN
jgi:hypothetical protein